jgi:hypothetical protein
MARGPLIHAVRIRQRLDAVLFMAVALGGAGVAIALRLLGVDPILTVAAVAALIPVYALIAWATGRARFEPEIVGDNCYYLGFLYTLVSLAWTLFSLGGAPEDADVVRSVVAGFGIALASTIVGILFRVMLQQFRTDVDLAERQARADLMQASARFRTELDQASHIFADAARGVSQKAGELTMEMAEENRRALADLHARAGEGIDAAAGALSRAADELRMQAAATSREMAAGNREAAAALAETAAALQDSAKATLATAEALRAAQAELAGAVDRLAPGTRGPWQIGGR